MSKAMETKEKIINHLKTGKKTVAELSGELNLVKSTVSQHLSELERIGAVHGYEDPHFRRNKYFELNPQFDINKIKERPIRVFLKYSLGIIAVLALLVSVYGSYNYSSGISAGAIISNSVGSAPLPAQSVQNPAIYFILVILAIIVVEALLAFSRLRQKATVITKKKAGIAVLAILYAVTVYIILSSHGYCECDGYGNYYTALQYGSMIAIVLVSTVATHLLLREDPKTELAMILLYLALVALFLFILQQSVIICNCPAIIVNTNSI